MFGITGNIPDVLWDGYYDPAKLEDGVMPAALRICLDNGDAQMLDVDFPNGNDNPHIVEDTACTLERLPEITLPF